MVIVHSHKDLAMIRKRANEGDWSRGEREIAAPMGTPTRLHGLLLGGAIDYAHIGSTIDESRAADRDLGLAIFATHQQMRPVVARWQRRRDERAVVERGIFIGDDPRRIAARSALAQPLPRVRGGSIEAVVAFEPLAIVFDLTAGLERVLRLRPGGEDNNGASDDQRGAHTPMRADRVSPCKEGSAARLPAPRVSSWRPHWLAGHVKPTSFLDGINAGRQTMPFAGDGGLRARGSAKSVPVLGECRKILATYRVVIAGGGGHWCT
jgi:hypothetical protein